MKNVRLYHYKEGGREGWNPGGTLLSWNVTVADVGVAGWLAGWLVGCFSVNSVERILPLILILSAPWRCGRPEMPFYIPPFN